MSKCRLNLHSLHNESSESKSLPRIESARQMSTNINMETEKRQAVSRFPERKPADSG